MDFAKRTAALRERMKKSGLAAAVIVKPVNQYYFSGFETVTYSRPIFTVIDDARCSIVLPGLVEAWGREISAADEFHPYFEHPAEAHRGTSALEKLAGLLRRSGAGGSVGIEMDVAPYALGAAIHEWGHRLADVGEAVVSLRARKTPAEIAAIEAASSFAAQAVASTVRHAVAGSAEREVEKRSTADVTAQAKRTIPGLAFDASSSMLLSGIARTVMPHALTGPRLLEKGDIVICTRQIAVARYYGDCQRTFFVGGRREDAQQRAYDVILESRRRAIEAMRPGVAASEVEHAARSVIDAAGYGAFFTHRLAKSSGLEPSEEPYIRFDSEYELAPGMVFNVMPSLYIPGLGGFRVSDTVLIEECGCRVLTGACPTDLDELHELAGARNA